MAVLQIGGPGESRTPVLCYHSIERLHVCLVLHFAPPQNQQNPVKYIRQTVSAISVVFETTTSLPAVLRHSKLARIAQNDGLAVRPTQAQQFPRGRLQALPND